MAGGKQPDWSLSAMDSDNRCKGKVGAAWNNEDGTISIKLQPFVVLDAMDDLKIKLFKYESFNDRKERERQSAATPSRETKSRAPSNIDLDSMPAEDDVPF